MYDQSFFTMNKQPIRALIRSFFWVLIHKKRRQGCLQSSHILYIYIHIFFIFYGISTRPFLSVVEKKWIVFQLLCALEQLHGVKVIFCFN